MLLRVARLDEVDKLLALYETARVESPFLLPRPKADFKEAVTHGRFFVVEDDGTLVAASAIFDYAVNLPFVELGDTYVAPSHRGLGLQGVFFRVRTAHVVATQGDHIGITTAIDPQNEPSLANKTKCGFDRWLEPSSAAFDSCPTCARRPSDRTCCCDFYTLPPERKREAVEEMLTATASGSLRLIRASRTIDIRVECRVCVDPELREDLREWLAATAP